MPSGTTPTEVIMASDERGIDRRKFLKIGAVTSGLAIGGCGKTEDVMADVSDLEMQFRPLGDTGLKVSAVSFGSYGFDNPALLSAALDAGMTTICTSGSYQNGRAEEAIGKAIGTIGGRRDELVLFTGAVVKAGTGKQSVLDSIDASLRRLQTDHVEIFRITSVNKPEELRVDALYEAFDEAKAAGKVGHLGLSGHHGGMQDVMNAAIDDGRFKVLFTKYDFASYPEQDQILSRAAGKGIGTLVFKTGAGNREKEIKDLEAGGLSYKQATIKWALTNPNVASVCVKVSNFSQIREYAEAAASKISEAEVAMLRTYASQMYDKYCRFCGTCEASCPHEVAVADVMRYAMYFKYYGREKDSMALYGELPPKCRAASCTNCSGSCDGACPFGRRVRDELVEAHRLLSFARA
jgi:aryl-alcohol dehydrogenase-like predicted oxidoreductase